jgi:hypothetical protein
VSLRSGTFPLNGLTNSGIFYLLDQIPMIRPINFGCYLDIA